MNTPRSRPLLRYPDSVEQRRFTSMRPNRWIGTITDPKFAEVLGHIVAQWAHLEETMIDILELLLGDSGDHAARQVFRSVNSTQARIKIMRTLLEESKLNEHRGAVFDEIIDEFAALTTERNNYAHGLWWTDGGGIISRSDPSDSPYSGPSYAKPISLKQAKQVLKRINDLGRKATTEAVREWRIHQPSQPRPQP